MLAILYSADHEVYSHRSAHRTQKGLMSKKVPLDLQNTFVQFIFRCHSSPSCWADLLAELLLPLQLLVSERVRLPALHTAQHLGQGVPGARDPYYYCHGHCHQSS